MKNSFKAALYPRALLLAAILAAASVNFLASAKDSTLYYLKAHKPNVATFLAPPPILGTPEQVADLNEVRAVYHSASSNDQAEAYSEKKFSIFNFAPAVGPFFAEDRLPKTAAFFKKVQSDAANVTDSGKDFFKRPRPYVTDPSLANGKLEKSFSYPSGHSTESMVIALVLADLLPDKHDAIIAHACQMGWRRVEIARHYPTDIFAGRTLAIAIVKQFKKSDAFQADFDAVKAELAAARKQTD